MTVESVVVEHALIFTTELLYLSPSRADIKID